MLQQISTATSIAAPTLDLSLLDDGVCQAEGEPYLLLRDDLCFLGLPAWTTTYNLSEK